MDTEEWVVYRRKDFSLGTVRWDAWTNWVHKYQSGREEEEWVSAFRVELVATGLTKEQAYQFVKLARE